MWEVGEVRVNCGRSKVSVGGVVDAAGMGSDRQLRGGGMRGRIDVKRELDFSIVQRSLPVSFESTGG